LRMSGFFVYCFFFQAEDGIRAFHVTGVQTCALPISVSVSIEVGSVARVACPHRRGARRASSVAILVVRGSLRGGRRLGRHGDPRSEERRVGKEWSSRWSECQERTEQQTQGWRAGRRR